MKKQKVKVRFHLAKGEHYMHWQVRYPNGDVGYYNPNTTHLYLIECKLHIQKKIAQTVFETGKKLVCGWVECDEVRTIFYTDKGTSVKFNPIETPHWLVDGEIADG